MSGFLRTLTDPDDIDSAAAISEANPLPSSLMVDGEPVGDSNPLRSNPDYQNSGDRPAPQVQTGTSTFETIRTQTTPIDVPTTALTAAGSPHPLITPTSGKAIRIMGWHLLTTAAGPLIFRRGASNTAVFRTGTLAANSGQGNPTGIGNGVLLPVNEALKLHVAVDGSVAGVVFVMEE